MKTVAPLLNTNHFMSLWVGWGKEIGREEKSFGAKILIIPHRKSSQIVCSVKYQSFFSKNLFFPTGKGPHGLLLIAANHKRAENLRGEIFFS